MELRAQKATYYHHGVGECQDLLFKAGHSCFFP